MRVFQPSSSPARLPQALLLSLLAHALALACWPPPAVFPAAHSPPPLSVTLNGGGARQDAHAFAAAPQSSPARSPPPTATPTPIRKPRFSPPRARQVVAPQLALAASSTSAPAAAAETENPPTSVALIGDEVSGAKPGDAAATGAGTAAQGGGSPDSLAADAENYRLALDRSIKRVAFRYRSRLLQATDGVTRILLSWRSGVARIVLQQSCGIARQDAIALDILREAVAVTPLPHSLEGHDFDAALPVEFR